MFSRESEPVGAAALRLSGGEGSGGRVCKGVWSEGEPALTVFGVGRKHAEVCGVPNVVKENRAFERPRLLGSKRTCPLCTGNVFRKAESGLLDGPLRLVGLQPVRCVNCWRRYYCRGGVAVGE